VGSVKQGGLALDDRPQIYLPFAQSPRAPAVVVVRVANEPAMQAGVVARTVAALDPTIPVYDVRTMQERLGQSVGTTRFSTVLASLFAVVSLVLGAVGIYSVLSHVVSQERREIGVRVALGASPADVMGDVLRRALVVTGLGVLVGTGAAWVLTRLLAGVFVGVSPHDPVVFIAAAVVFAAVAALAASIPAYRTTRVSPVVALTY
jgi:ABC-type antimicrobial peptide transport system permease subunit